MALEIVQLKQLHPVPIRVKEQLTPFPIIVQFQGEVRNGLAQKDLTPGGQLLPPDLRPVLLQRAAQFPLFLFKGPPRSDGPLPEGFLKVGQRQTLSAILNEFQGIPVAGAGLQRLLEVAKGQALLI